MRNVVIMGAGGRDFHTFKVVFRGDPGSRVVAFTAAQIPGIADRTYPSSLAGPAYPHGIRIVGEERLADLIRDEAVDEVVLAYSDLSHIDVMHKASTVLAAGADFRLVGPHASMLRSRRPVIAVCAVRTGCGKSQTSRRIGRLLVDAGLRVALVRHPMPYGDLDRMRVQRFTTLDDIDAADPTIEEREEYEAPVPRVSPSSSIRARTPPVPSPPPTRRTPPSAASCRPWGTASASSTSSAGPSGRPSATRSSSARPWTWAAWSTLGIRPGA
jgi:predicted GTPase